MRLYDIAFYAALFAILGIAAASLELNIWLAFLAWLAVATGFYGFRKFHWKYFLILPLIGFLGFFYFHFYLTLQEEDILFGEEIVFQGDVFKEPTHGLKSEEIDIKLRPLYEGEARIYTEPSREFHYGDLIEVKGEVNKSPTGRLNIVSFPEITIISSNNGSPIKK